MTANRAHPRIVFPLRPLAGLILASALACGSPLDETLARMDKSAAGFRGLQANVRRLSYTAVIKDSSEESGRISIYRPRPRDLRMLVEFDRPDPRAVSFQNKKVQIFYPKLNTVQEYDLGKQGSLVDQFVLLGFGTSSSDLKKSYSIKYVGEETVEGVKADRLDLVPLSSEVLNHFRHIEIWVSREDGITVQQQLFQPSRDYTLFVYSAIKLNPAMGEESVRLKLPKGVKKETPQR